MAFKLKNRSKSASNIVDEIVNDEEKFLQNASMEYPDNIYIPDDWEKRKRNCVRNGKKEMFSNVPSTQKSQNFVQKLIAALERKNEVCKAHNEFLTKYYKRNDFSNPNFDVLRNTEKEILKKTQLNEAPIHNFVKEDNFRSRTFYEKTAAKKQYFKGNLNGNVNYSTRDLEFVAGASISGNLDRSDRDQFFKNSQLTKHKNLPPNIVVNKIERKDKGSCGISSFDPSRSRVEYQNRRDSLDSFHRIKDKNDRKRATLERHLVNSEEDGNYRKKISRKTSFKDIFGSIIKWKKSGNRASRKSRLFMSCDHLNDELMHSESEEFRRLPRTTSLQSVMFGNTENFFTQNEDRRATIRPIYGGRRNETLLKGCTRKEMENDKRFVVTGGKNFF